MKLSEKFVRWEEWRRNTFVLIVFALMIGVIMLPFSLLGLPGLSLGWMAGSMISVLAYLTIVYSSNAILRKENDGKGMGLSVFFSFARMAMYAIGLALGALVTFVFKSPWLSFWTVFAGYMPMPILIAAMHFVNLGKKKDAQSANPMPKGETSLKEPDSHE